MADVVEVALAGGANITAMLEHELEEETPSLSCGNDREPEL